MSIPTITVEEIPAARQLRAEIVAAQPAFGSPNSHNSRIAARRAAKRIEKQIYRARRASK